MSQDRDPMLESFFAQAQQELVDEQFAAAVMHRIKARSRRVLAGRLAIVALIAALELLLDAPLQNSVGVITEVLGAPLYRIESEWLAFALTPVNSLAGLLGLGLLGLHFIYRRVFY